VLTAFVIHRRGRAPLRQRWRPSFVHSSRWTAGRNSHSVVDVAASSSRSWKKALRSVLLRLAGPSYTEQQRLASREIAKGQGWSGGPRGPGWIAFLMRALLAHFRDCLKGYAPTSWPSLVAAGVTWRRRGPVAACGGHPQATRGADDALMSEDWAAVKSSASLCTTCIQSSTAIPVELPESAA
jgi:hypothetical protein